MSTHESNPWLVDNAEVFLKYSCPECDHHAKELDEFKDHAVNKHELSKVLFNDVDEEMPESSKYANSSEIKEENNFSEEEYEDKMNESEIPLQDSDLQLTEFPNEDFIVKEEVGINDFDDENDFFPVHEFLDDVILPNEAFDDENAFIDIPNETYQLSQPYHIVDPLNYATPDVGVKIFSDMPSNEHGWWICQECPNASFLFDFELIDHYKSVHDVVGLLSGLAIKSTDEMLERNAKLAQNKWQCFSCVNETVTHSSKYELINHWLETHKKELLIYEACQYCIELFVGTNYQVIFFFSFRY